MHTPTPYRVDVSDTNGHCGWSIFAGDRQIATVYAGRVESPGPKGGNAALPQNQESIETARFIVRASNVHGALVEALKAAMEAMNHMGDVLNDMDAVEEEDEKFFSAFDQVRTALALAEQP